MNRSIYLKHLSALIVLSASLFMLDRTSLFSSISGFIGNNILRPTVTQSQISLNSGTHSIASILSVRTLSKKISETEVERDYYRGEYMRLQAIAEENELLRQALQLGDDSQKLIIAEISSINSLLPHDLIEINKGLSSGIRTGDAVITENRVLVGVIDKVENETSTVRLVTSESSTLPALLASSGTHASLRGSATGVLNLELIPREVSVSGGELVITSGVTGSIPSHLLIGDIQRIIDNETASFKRAVVRPLSNVSELQHLFVITAF